jgi:hypothetical protein
MAKHKPRSKKDRRMTMDRRQHNDPDYSGRERRIENDRRKMMNNANREKKDK